jgi:uncharacterized membrane protein (UPF0127 family)/CheY-like chemotaxis protein
LTRTTKLIVNATRGRCLCVAELADGPLARLRGLIGREGLPAGEGLLLGSAPRIHTAFLRFSIDALFLDRELRVLAIATRVRPWRIVSRRRARGVLQLAAGESARCGVQVGDRLRTRERKPARSAAPRQGSESIIWAPSLASAPQRARDAPLSVLVVSEDRHFRNVTAMLLAHRGCTVTAIANLSSVAELLAHTTLDVVVVDAGSSALRTRRSSSSVRSLGQPVGIVLVGEQLAHGSPEHRVLAKWGPFADIFEAIERAARSGASRRGRGAPR